MDYKELKDRVLSTAEVREQYEALDAAYEIGKMIVDARIRANLTQERLAAKVGTKQPSIARLENGSGLPSLSFLDKIARAVGAILLPPQFYFGEIFSVEFKSSKPYKNSPVRLGDPSDSLIISKTESSSVRREGRLVNV